MAMLAKVNHDGVKLVRVGRENAARLPCPKQLKADGVEPFDKEFKELW
jgi:hypothetical protein